MKNLLILFALLTAIVTNAQPVTGVWIGKVTKGNGLARQTYKLEVKLIKKGDSIVGTSYYYAGPGNYYRYSVKGYFSGDDNSINWWDDQLIESKSSGLKLGGVNNTPLVASTDYNCPGSGIMKLDGKASKTVGGGDDMEIHLDKHSNPVFKDEWDPVIRDYFYGAADPDIIDSVSRIAFLPKPVPNDVVIATPPKKPVYQQPKPEPIKPAPSVKKEPAKQPDVAIVKPLPQPPDPVFIKPVYIPPPTIEEKFQTRKNTFTKEIPITADSIEFRFYDNAEVDGDSISVFLNRKMLDTHVRLSEKAYIIRIATADLGAENELVMVAENLGSIPPNTAYMEAWSGSIRFTARLESTEQSSAMIRLVRR